MEFKCRVIVRYEKTVYVEANDWEEAEDKVDDMLCSGELDPVADFDDARTNIYTEEC